MSKENMAPNEISDEVQQALENFPVETESKETINVQIRFILAAMGFYCFFVLSAMRNNLSVAIVAMVNWAVIRKNVSMANETEECHYTGNLNHEETLNGSFTWDPTTQGHILSCYFYGLASTQLAGGLIAEMVSAKYVLLAGTAVATIANFLIPVVADDNGYGVMALQVFKGFGQGIVLPAFSVLMGKWVPPGERTRFMSVITSGLPVGSFFATVLSGIICKTKDMGWPFAFYIFGIVAVIWCFLWVILIYESPLTHPYISREELNKIMTLRTQHAPILNVKVPIKAILTSLPVWAYIAVGFSSYWALCLYISVIPIFLGTVLKFNIETNGLMAAMPMLSEAFILLSAGNIADRLLNKNIFTVTTVRKACVCIGLGGFSLSILLITMTGCHRISTVLFLVLALGLSGFSFASTAIIPVDMAPRFAGTISGLMNTLGALSGVIIPTLVGYFTKDAQTMQQWSKIFYVSAFICLLGATIFIFFGSGEQQSWSDPSNSDMQEPLGGIELGSLGTDKDGSGSGKKPLPPKDPKDSNFEDDKKP